MIYLTDTEIERLVEIDEAIPALDSAFKALSDGRAAVQPRVRTEAGAVKLSTLGAVLPEQDVAGAKVYTTIKGRFSFAVVLFSTRDGSLLATLDSNVLTRIRTAATTVLAVRALARPGARVATVFGTGVQGRAHAFALAGHTEVRTIRIVGAEGGDPLVDELNHRFAHRGVEALAMQGSDALRGADIVVTATRATEPLFDGNALAPGALVAAIGSSLPYTRELDDTTVARANRVVVELREQAAQEAGDLVQAAPGTFDWADVVELGDVLGGRRTGRDRADDIVLYKAVGIGLQDIAVAQIAYRNHVARRATTGLAVS
ncbi:ornithine cyclodeaminase family protein [Paraburkholderia acidipaludis]|uniref:ornithine cyclodeaminase family protein n=1 Tax=Paraburkholderia acidipaludis TaxID=660537 RepID=UPI00047F3296|nr:ornithine cyclodeaminase family protein [Paraburkholderia acidipaludis]